MNSDHTKISDQWRETTRELDEARAKYRLLELYRTFGHALEEANGASGKAELPVPATFLIDGNGTIRLAHVDVDYTRRLDPDDVIVALRELNGVRGRQNESRDGKMI